MSRRANGGSVSRNASAEFVDRVAAQVRMLAAVKPALVRWLLEWLIDAALSGRSQVSVALRLPARQPGSSERNDGQDCRGRDDEIPINSFGEYFHARPREQESYLPNLRIDRALSHKRETHSMKATHSEKPTPGRPIGRKRPGGFVGGSQGSRGDHSPRRCARNFAMIRP